MLCASFALTAQSVPADYPGWWMDHDVIGESDDHGNNQNYHPALLGQLKWMATAARDELEMKLAHEGGAGTAINTLVNGFSTGSAGNYAPTLIGQLKHVASLYYNRLDEVGYDGWEDGSYLKDALQAYDADPLTVNYPWDKDTDYAVSYQPANLGQLKFVFSWDVHDWATGIDTEGDGLPDWWEMYYFGHRTDFINLWQDSDGDGATDYAEYLANTDPNAEDTPASTYEGSINGDVLIVLLDEGACLASEDTEKTTLTGTFATQ